MFQVKKSVEEIRIKDAVAILQTLPEWWKRRISGKAKDYAVEPAVMERLKSAGLVEMCNGEFNEYRQTKLGAELVEMYTNIYYYQGEGCPLSTRDLADWEEWFKRPQDDDGAEP